MKMTDTSKKIKPIHELSDAILDNDFERVQKAIQNGALEESKTVPTDISLLTIKSLWEMQPLIKAIKHNADENIIDALVQGGATYDIPNIFNCTGLYFATVDGNTALVSKLLQLNANPNITNSFGETPLHMAVLCGHADCVKILCQAQNIDITVRDNHNRTAWDCCENLHNRRSACSRSISQYTIDEIKATLSQKMGETHTPKTIIHNNIVRQTQSKELERA